MKNIIILLLMLPFMAFAQYELPGYFVFLNSNPDREALQEDSVQSLQVAHLANIDSLYSLKKITAAGPFENGGGIFILRAPDIDSAQLILNTDPAVQAGRFLLETYPMEIIVGENKVLDSVYDMISLDFIRLIKKAEKASILDQEYRKHLALINDAYNSGIILFAAKLGHDEILIFAPEKDQAFDAFKRNDLLIKMGYFIPEQKRLWIAGGTF